MEVILEAPTAGNSSGVECSCHITLARVNSIQSISNATFSKVLYFLPRKASLGRGGPKACRPQISKRGIMGLVRLMIMEPSSGYSVRSLNLISLNVINTNAPLPCCCCHTPSSCSLKELSWSVYLASLTSLLRSLVPLNGLNVEVSVGPGHRAARQGTHACLLIATTTNAKRRRLHLLEVLRQARALQ